ncbi:hypothetical protein AVEN_109811-1 [Araneus ventricosus]|uniref:Uncharacterized protein n=1 Tax=Araneus ventricosus TaxID=182803 RepID=A0A4Y2GDT5_ARAVE|nr:hypothetical protein AVEN_109811-1 [Araneus ventricosus]
MMKAPAKGVQMARQQDKKLGYEYCFYASLRHQRKVSVLPINGQKKLDFTCLWIACETASVMALNHSNKTEFDVYGSIASTGEGVSGRNQTNKT